MIDVTELSSVNCGKECQSLIDLLCIQSQLHFVVIDTGHALG